MQVIKPGYKAFNGYVFTEADCAAYNRACRDTQTTDSQRHNIFCLIINQKQNKN